MNGAVPGAAGHAVTLAAVLAVAVGGAAGSVARYLATLAMARHIDTFPAGTLLVNVVGSLLLGIFARVFSGADHDPVVRLALTTGLCGGFTTFSALSAETVALLQQGRAGRAALYVVVSLLLGVGATALGMFLARPRP